MPILTVVLVGLAFKLARALSGANLPEAAGSGVRRRPENPRETKSLIAPF